jgi:hypothetical protein
VLKMEFARLAGFGVSSVNYDFYEPFAKIQLPT